jgi:hypothetical protein
VRRNAVLAIFSLYRSFDYLLPDAPEIIFNFLQKVSDVSCVSCVVFLTRVRCVVGRARVFLAQEGDASCQRNAFLMLLNCAQPKVVEYLETITADQVLGFADTLQLMVMELIRKVWHSKPDARVRIAILSPPPRTTHLFPPASLIVGPCLLLATPPPLLLRSCCFGAHQAKYLQCAFTMLKSSTPSVQFESATTLVSMTSGTAVGFLIPTSAGREIGGGGAIGLGICGIVTLVVR